MREIINIPDTNSFAFTSHTVISGKSGSGKSNMAEFLLENMQLSGKWKCVDFDISGRLENTTYGVPEDNPALFLQMFNHPDLIRNHKLRPTAFKNEVLLFCGRGLFSQPKLPNNFRVVSFRKEDLTWEFINILLGGTESLAPVLNSLQYEFGSDLNFKDISDLFLKGEFRGEPAEVSDVGRLQRIMIVNRLRSWEQTGLFSDSVEKIDFEKILNDTSTITCINTYLLEGEWESEIAVSIFLNKILSLAKYRKLNARVTCFLREIWDYMNWKLARIQILDILRKGRILGRGGVDLIGDSQRGTDLEPQFRRQFGYAVQLKSDFEDAKRLQEIQSIPPEFLAKVPHFGVGKFLVATGVRYDLPVEAPPARHKHVSPEFDVLRLLGKRYGFKIWKPDEIFKGIGGFVKVRVKADYKIERFKELAQLVVAHDKFRPKLGPFELKFLVKEVLNTAGQRLEKDEFDDLIGAIKLYYGEKFKPIEEKRYVVLEDGSWKCQRCGFTWKPKKGKARYCPQCNKLLLL